MHLVSTTTAIRACVPMNGVLSLRAHKAMQARTRSMVVPIKPGLLLLTSANQKLVAVYGPEGLSIDQIGLRAERGSQGLSLLLLLCTVWHFALLSSSLDATLFYPFVPSSQLFVCCVIVVLSCCCAVVLCCVIVVVVVCFLQSRAFEQCRRAVLS
jgi:hypothetical protein